MPDLSLILTQYLGDDQKSELTLAHILNLITAQDVKIAYLEAMVNSLETGFNTLQLKHKYIFSAVYDNVGHADLQILTPPSAEFLAYTWGSLIFYSDMAGPFLSETHTQHTINLQSPSGQLSPTIVHRGSTYILISNLNGLILKRTSGTDTVDKLALFCHYLTYPQTGN